MKSSTTIHEVPKILYSRKEAAFALGVSVRSLDYLIATRELPTRRIGSKVLIPAGELRRYANADHFGPVNGERHREAA
jgi:excisionase family DNA binding protein